MEELLAAAFYALVDLLFVKTGAVLIRLVTLKRWEVERVTSAEYRFKAAAGALWFRREGQTVVTVTGQGLAGLLGWLALIGVAVVSWPA